MPYEFIESFIIDLCTAYVIITEQTVADHSPLLFDGWLALNVLSKTSSSFLQSGGEPLNIYMEAIAVKRKVWDSPHKIHTPANKIFYLFISVLILNIIF